MNLCKRCQALALADDPNYPGLCALCAWREFYYAVGGEHWDRAGCVECELGRCTEHEKGRRA